MPPLSLLFKTVSADCNLDCGYCYYRESSEGTRLRRRIDRAMLEALLPQYMEYIADVGQANFAWQGGEPTDLTEFVDLPLFGPAAAATPSGNGDRPEEPPPAEAEPTVP